MAHATEAQGRAFSTGIDKARIASERAVKEFGLHDIDPVIGDKNTSEIIASTELDRVIVVAYIRKWKLAPPRVTMVTIADRVTFGRNAMTRLCGLASTMRELAAGCIKNYFAPSMVIQFFVRSAVVHSMSKNGGQAISMMALQLSTAELSILKDREKIARASLAMAISMQPDAASIAATIYDIYRGFDAASGLIFQSHMTLAHPCALIVAVRQCVEISEETLRGIADAKAIASTVCATSFGHWRSANQV